MKSRVAAIDQDRAALAELQGKYGLALHGDTLYQQAADLKLPRKILSPPKIVIPCRAELKDAGPADPCLIVPPALPIELLPSHKSIAVGGQVLSITRSLYALPNYLIDETWRAQGYWNGQPLPLLVSLRGEYRYLVRQKSYFFKFETYRGSDVDHVSPMEPQERDLKLGRYQWGSDMSDELTVVIADY